MKRFEVHYKVDGICKKQNMQGPSKDTVIEKVETSYPDRKVKVLVVFEKKNYS